MPTITDRTRKRLSPKQLRNQYRASRRQQARKARASRRQIDRIHDQLPKQVRTVFDPLEPAFTHPTHHRLVFLALAAILTLRGRTIANLLRCLGSLAPGHPSSYHRFFSRDRWSSGTLARCFAQQVLARFVADGPIELAGDDTVEEHPGKNVYGKGCHRDPVRSTHSFTAYRWGHKWVALTVLVRVPFATRRWALPLLMALDLPEEENHRQGRRHKTPAELMQQMLAVLIHWFPDRQFIFTGDGGYGTHALASFAHRHCRHFEPGQPLLSQRQLVRSAAGGSRQEAEPSAPQEGGQAARSSSGRGGDGPTEKAQRLLVRWRPPECRSSERDGPTVEEWRGVDTDSLGIRPRPDRDPS